MKLILILMLGCLQVYGQQASTVSADDSMTPQEEQSLRDAGKRMDPAKLEKLISEIKARRKKSAEYRSNPKQSSDELMAIVEKMQRNNSAANTEQFNQARQQLDARLYWFSQNKVSLSSQLGNSLSEALIDIYRKRAAYTSVADNLPSVVSAKYGSSSKVKTYLIKILQGKSGDERTAVLQSLGHTNNLKGDVDIYAVLSGELKRSGTDNSDLAVLGTMRRIDADKTLPLIEKEVDSTKDIHRFIASSSALSQYNRPELLDHVLRRISDFPVKSWGDSENSTLGIDDNLLLRYISENEDEKLDMALRALNQDVGALNKCPVVILKKLNTGTLRSRRAIAKFLQQTSGIEPFKKSDVAQTLQGYLNKESDPETKKALGVVVNRIYQNHKGGGHE